MAPTRKSAKRTTGKKRSGAKRSAKTRPARKAASKRRAKKVGARAVKKSNLKRKAKKGLRVAREGLDTVRQAGEKTWQVLKSTTTQVMDGVRDLSP
jgi:hypothetical protein